MSGFKSDHQLVRDYITAHDHLQYTTLPEGVVAITLTHSNLPAKHVDIRLELHSTVQAVKERFRVHIGTSPEYQRLQLVRHGQVLAELENHRLLGYYSVLSGDELHVIDTDPYSLSRNGGLTDVSLVEKYKMSEEAYDSRKGTMRDYIREQRSKDPNYRLKAKSAGPEGAPKEPKEIPTAESVQGITVGSRCEVAPGGRRGEVKFVGEMPGRGYWVGVVFDEPVGHNDGTVKGVAYFSCVQGYGAFVRGDRVSVGDFPERDPFAEDEEDGAAAAGGKQEEEQDEDEI